MKIDGNTEVYGLIGNPVGHTLSPDIHHFLAEQCRHNMVYVPLRVEPDRLEDAIRGAAALNLSGCNVTIPYKSAVIPYLQDVDPMARKIGAVNTLVRSGDGFKGYNTDYSGLARAMKSDGIRIQGTDAVILGAGGAARSAAFLLAEEKAANIYIINRTFSEAERLAAELRKENPSGRVSAVTVEEFLKLDADDFLAIQATGVGMYPDTERAVTEEKEFYRKIRIAYDVVFNPCRTKFMELAESAGAMAYNGLKMLVYQGIEAYGLWNAIRVSENMAEEIYEKLKGKSENE